MRSTRFGGRHVVLLTLLLIRAAASAQTATQDSLWRPLVFFEGSWTGRGGGEPGIGDYERSYRFLLNRKFLEVRNKSTYPPTAKFPRGEVHQDLGYFSYDKVRRTFVLRQFHIEGFVNQYVLDSLSADGNRLVFISEAIENIPKGWRAKESYDIISPGEFVETFELAAPGEPFAIYTRVTMRRTGR